MLASIAVVLVASTTRSTSPSSAGSVDASTLAWSVDLPVTLSPLLIQCLGVLRPAHQHAGLDDGAQVAREQATDGARADHADSLHILIILAFSGKAPELPRPDVCLL